MSGIAFTTDDQLMNLLLEANKIQKQTNISSDLEAYKATIDMQGMIALYAKGNILKLRSARGEDTVHGPSADSTNPQFWKDLYDSKTWAIKGPLSQFFSSTKWNDSNNWHESEMEASGDAHIDTKSFFSGVKSDWMKMKGVQGGVEELTTQFLTLCNGVDLKDLNQNALPGAQQCVSIGTISDDPKVKVSQPCVSILWIGLDLVATETLTEDGEDGPGEKIRARIEVSQSQFEATLNLSAIRRSKDYLDMTRRKMLDAGVDDFEKILTDKRD